MAYIQVGSHGYRGEKRTVEDISGADEWLVSQSPYISRLYSGTSWALKAHLAQQRPILAVVVIRDPTWCDYQRITKPGEGFGAHRGLQRNPAPVTGFAMPCLLHPNTILNEAVRGSSSEQDGGCTNQAARPEDRDPMLSLRKTELCF